MNFVEWPPSPYNPLPIQEWSAAMRQMLDPFAGAKNFPPARPRWRDEWLYIKAVLRKFRFRLLFLLTVLVGGALLFQFFHRESGGAAPTFFRGLYYTWCLIFFQLPVSLPDSPVLGLMFFAVPVLGLTVLVETFAQFVLTLRDRRNNEREWCRMIAAEMSEHVVLVGLGRLGYRTYGHLRRMKMSIVVVESNEKSQFLETVRADRTPLIIGDARNNKILEETNLTQARSVICCTSDDLINLEVALDARAMNPGIRVVMRMFDQTMADKIRSGFNIHVAFSASAMAAPSFAAAAVDRTIKNSYVVDGQLVVTSQVKVEAASEFADRTVDEICRRVSMRVIAYQRPNESAVLFPKDEVTVKAGDEILVQLRFEDLREFHRINRSTGNPPVVAR